MARPTCPKCSNTSFEASEYAPRGSAFKYLFISCSSCGCVVGTNEYYNIGVSLFETEPTLNTRFKEIKSQISNLRSIEVRLSDLENSIQTLLRKIK